MKLMNAAKRIWDRPPQRLFIGWLIFGALFAAWLATCQVSSDSGAGMGLGNYMNGVPLNP